MADYKTYLQAEQYKTPKNFNARTALLKAGDNPVSYWEWLSQQYDFAKATNILELGCGDGAFWQYAYHHLLPGQALTLTDFSAGMLEAAKSALEALSIPTKVHYQKEDVEATSFPNHSFDLVLAHLLLHHLSDPSQAIQEIKRTLKPGGIAGITAFPKDTFSSLFDLINRHVINEPYINPAIAVVDDEYETLLKKTFRHFNRQGYLTNIKTSDIHLVMGFIHSLGIKQKVSVPDNFYHLIETDVKNQILQNGYFETKFKLTLFTVSI